MSLFLYFDELISLVYQMVTGLLTSGSSAHDLQTANVKGVELYYDLIRICLKFDPNFLHFLSPFLSDFLMISANLNMITENQSKFNLDVGVWHDMICSTFDNGFEKGPLTT